MTGTGVSAALEAVLHLPGVVPHIDLAAGYRYLVAASAVLGVVTVVYLLLLRIARDRRSR